jgi:hypothetical protein
MRCQWIAKALLLCSQLVLRRQRACGIGAHAYRAALRTHRAAFLCATKIAGCFVTYVITAGVHNMRTPVISPRASEVHHYESRLSCNRSMEVGFNMEPSRIRAKLKHRLSEIAVPSFHLCWRSSRTRAKLLHALCKSTIFSGHQAPDPTGSDPDPMHFHNEPWHMCAIG